MQKIRKVFYASLSSALLLAPALAAAQWNVGAENVVSSGLPSGSIYNIIAASMKWLLAILGFIAVIAFVIAGILYLTAAGDEAQIEKAKKAMTYSIIGVIVALMGYVIVQAVSLLLGGQSTAF